MLSNQALKCFNKKCLTENPFFVLLTCAMVANSEYDYFVMIFCRIIYFTWISTMSFSFRLTRHTLVQTALSPFQSSQSSSLNPSPVHFISVESSSLCIQSKTRRPFSCSPVRPSPVRAFPFQVVQSIITRQVLTFVTSITRIWMGKRGEVKGQRSIGFFLLFLSVTYAEARKGSIRRR